MKKMHHMVFGVIILLAIIGSQFFMAKARINRPFDVKTSGLYFLPPGKFLSSVSLDNSNTMADYFWINMILTIGKTHHEHKHDDPHNDHHGHECNHTEEEIEISKFLDGHLAKVLPNYIETITDLDPYFSYPYLIGFLFVFTDNSDDKFARHILEKAMLHNPDYWEFPFFYAFFLNHKSAAADSVILEYLRRSVKAQKSIRVFRKDLVYDTYSAFYNKLHPNVKSEKLLEGLIEAIDNPRLKERILSRFPQ